MAKPSDTIKVVMTRSEWNLIDEAIKLDRRSDLSRIIKKMMDQVGQ